MGWGATLFAQFAFSSAQDAGTTHGTPFLLAMAVVAGSIFARFLRGAPLLLPVALVILFAPLFTNDLWRAADQLHAREFVLLFCLTVLPLVLALVPQLVGTARDAFLHAADNVSHDLRSLDTTTEAIQRLGQGLPEQEIIAAAIRPAFADGFVDAEASGLQSKLRRSVQRRLLSRLVSMTFGLGVCVTFYIYLLAWTAISSSTVTDWLGTSPPHKRLPVIGSVPTGPYIQVAVLLGILATAIFFAFVLTDEEKYAGTLSDLVIHRPLREGARLALPYALLCEKDPASVVVAKAGAG